MKYLCLVYLDEKRLPELPDEDCVAYDKAKEPLFRHIRPRDGEAEEIEPIWPRRWIDRKIEATGPGPIETDTTSGD